MTLSCRVTLLFINEHLWCPGPCKSSLLIKSITSSLVFTLCLMSINKAGLFARADCSNIEGKSMLQGTTTQSVRGQLLCLLCQICVVALK